jgi:hypothetical protein
LLGSSVSGFAAAEGVGTGNDFAKGVTKMDVAINRVDDKARAAAEFVGHCLFHRHRGAFDCGDKVVLFGNDGYDVDARSRKEVELVRSGLEAMGVEAAGFGTGFSEDGGNWSWAIVVENYGRKPISIRALDALVRKAWHQACVLVAGRP